MKLLNASEIAKKIQTVQKTGQQFQNAVQIAAVSIFAHMAKSRDKTLIINLYDAMPNGSRRKTMVDWFNSHAVQGFGSQHHKEESDRRYGRRERPRMVGVNKALPTIIETMIENPWFGCEGRARQGYARLAASRVP